MTASWRRSSFLPLASGLLLTASFPPLHLLLPPFIALVPLLFFLESAGSAREAARGGLIMGLIHNLTLLYWTAIFSWIGFFLLMAYLSLYPLSWCLIHYALRRRLATLSFLVAPVSWVCIEYIRGIGELGFTWGQLSYSLTGFPLLLQTADTTGPYGISLWIACVNLLLFLALRANTGAGKLVSLGAVAASLVAVLGYGLHRESHYRPGREITVGIVQPGLDQETKWDPVFQDSILSLLSAQTRQVAGDHTDLVIWPETAVPSYFKYDLSTMTLVSELARDIPCSILLGAPHYEVVGDEYRTFNIALLYHADGIMDEKIYKKIHLVPFGEKTPWEDSVNFLKKVDLGGGHFTEGNEFTLLELDGTKIGTLICFESIFPELARSMRRAGANLLVNITNDAWFRRTSAPYQHASAVVLRAIENRISIARAANTGVSLTVDPFGRVREETPIFVRTTIRDTLAVVDAPTLYTKLGDVILIPCWALFLGGMLLGRFLEILGKT
jgi:apolipoprotein N-acyltransferase